MFFIRFLTILVFLPIFSTQAVEETYQHKNGWKIQKIEKPMRFPDDVPFYDSDNKKSYIEDFEGKTALIVFWATWCAPCHAEMLELDVLKKDFRKLSLEIIPISQDYQGVAAVKTFYEANEIRYLPIYHDYKNELFRELKIAGLPTCYILDSEGYIKAIITGAISWHDEELRDILLGFIEGNPVKPKNSYRDNSLNQNIKQPKLKEEVKKPDENPPSLSEGEKLNNKALEEQEQNVDDKQKTKIEKNDTKNGS